jgi:NAD(P)H-dependent flavin oxidoreductase YrpB (nitropropane dioxygenase family)
MMRLRTSVCELLGIDVPVVQAGMGPLTSAELVAAVSNAGGLGILGAVLRPADALRAEIHRIRELTDRPFGVNHVLALLDAEAMEVTLDERVPVLSTSWGDIGPYVTRAHDLGMKMIHQVVTASQAAQAAEAGADVVIAQGTDGGGHVGAVGTMPLVPRAVDASAPVPVLAAGGIVDGRGLAAALALGAQGVLMGTRFLATAEAPCPPAWQQAILAANESDTVRSTLFDDAIGMPVPGSEVRAIRNRFQDEWIGRETGCPLGAGPASRDAQSDADGCLPDRERGGLPPDGRPELWPDP